MARKEFIRLFESNILIFDKLADKLKKDPSQVCGHPRQQISVLVRLYLKGRAKLKDIARSEFATAPNLCATFRKLEKDGLVARAVDEQDRRNTWYCCTVDGEELARKALDTFRLAIEKLFENLSREDEEILTLSMKNINKVLSNMELGNA